jgi:hypothetical protein
MKAIGLDKYITDADSQIKYSAMSSDPTVATATLPVGDRSVTITALKVGTATITVTARDGDNDPVEAPISVTVVRSNDLPTTNDLSPLDKTELEKVLYKSDGARTDTVTVVASPGGTSSESLADSIDDFKVVINKTVATTDDLVTVKVTRKGTTGAKYDIVVTPKPSAINALDKGGSQTVMIYPEDMFGAASIDAWEFKAMFNTTPKTLVDSFGVIRLIRGAVTAGSGGAADSLADISFPTSTEDGNAITIEIADYFNLASLKRMPKANATPGTVLAAEIDEVGDTECEVTVSTTLATVQMLNEMGTVHADTRTDGTEGEVIATDLRKLPQALGAIRIDSRVSSFGTDGIFDPALVTPGVVAHPSHDTRATGEGAFPITIRCTDRDDTAEVTGTVVVQQG